MDPSTSPKIPVVEGTITLDLEDDISLEDLFGNIRIASRAFQNEEG